MISRLKQSSVLVFGLLVANVVSVSAQGLSLSLSEARQYAVDHNRTVQNASLDVRKAEALRWKAIASMLPQVSASADYSDMFGYKMDLGEMQVSMPPYISYGLTTSVAFSGGQLVSVGLQNLSRKMSDISLRKSELEISNQVRELYCSALVTEESIDLLAASLESLQSLYQMTLKSVEVGVADQTDADQLFVQVSTMENSMVSTKRALEIVYNSMRLLLNIGPDVQLILTDSLENILDFARVDAVLAEQFDIKDNYSLQLLEANAELAKKQIQLASWSNGPSLSIYHQYTKKQYISNERTMNMTPPNMLGISLKIPLFTSLSTTMGIKDAKLAYQKQVNTLEDTEYSLKLQHSQYVYNLRTALDKYKTQNENVEVAQRLFDNIARKYKYGVASSMELTNANTSLITAKSNYVQSILEILEAQIALEGLMNK